jgi:tripartite ATP-independent transporter DctM subunit
MAMNTAGVTTRIYDFCECLAGRFRGGLAHVNVIGSVIFAGMSGSAVADAAGLGTIEIKAMTDEGYPWRSLAVTAASATIGPIIPPSVPLLIYGVIADVSIGRLFAGGFIPGFLMAAALMVMIRFCQEAGSALPGPHLAEFREKPEGLPVAHDSVIPSRC